MNKSVYIILINVTLYILINPLTAAGQYIVILLVLKNFKNYVHFIYLQLCVVYIYKLILYLIHTTLIYKYNVHII